MLHSVWIVCIDHKSSDKVWKIDNYHISQRLKPSLPQKNEIMK